MALPASEPLTPCSALSAVLARAAVDAYILCWPSAYANQWFQTGNTPMPMYEFECQSCQEQFEELVTSEAAVAAVACPACQSREVVKRFSTFGVGRSSEGAMALPVGSPGPCGRCGNPQGSCQWS